IRSISCPRLALFGSSAGPSTTIPTNPFGTERRAPAAAGTAASAHSDSTRAVTARRRMVTLPRSGLHELAPRRVAAFPELVEEKGVLVGVHAVPEALVPVCVQLARRPPG